MSECRGTICSYDQPTAVSGVDGETTGLCDRDIKSGIDGMCLPLDAARLEKVIAKLKNLIDENDTLLTTVYHFVILRVNSRRRCPMKGNRKVLCCNCRKRVSYTIKARKEARNIKGIDYLYNEKYAICDECGEEITIPGLDDANEREIDDIYRRNNGLITIGEITELMEKYNIEKRPLSNLLGFGELTITRYLDGQLPTKRYSDMLLRLLHYDEEMKQLLEKGKGKITTNAYRKVEEAIQHRERLLSHETKIEMVALYMISSFYDITNLSLQKLLYYFKAFGYVLCGKDLLQEECEAWVHGPVFPGIYEKYKIFGREVIPNEADELDFNTLLTEDEQNVADYVLECFGIYNGGVLRELTHQERPWREAREGLGDTERCTNIIKNEEIQQYFTEMDGKYKLHKKSGVEDYIKSLYVI